MNAVVEDGDTLFLARISGKLGGDGLFQFATIENGRWKVRPGIEKMMQDWLDKEQPDNVSAGCSVDQSP